MRSYESEFKLENRMIEQLIKQEYLTEISKRPITHIISDKLQEVLD